MQNYYISRRLTTCKEIALPTDCINIVNWSIVTAQALHSKYSKRLHHATGKADPSDMDHKSDLLSTLEAYIRYGGLTQDAIDSLSVSKSTAFYRLNKIRELCPLDIDNGVIRSRILVALCAYRMYGQVDM